MVATLSEFAMPSIGIATAASAVSTTFGETPLRSAPNTNVAGNTGTICSGRTLAVVCSATKTQAPSAFASAIACAPTLYPRHPVLSALRRLHQPALT
jgi:hypothetical protein